MDLAEQKESKQQLKDLVDKGFIQLSISSWGALVLFLFKRKMVQFVYVPTTVKFTLLQLRISIPFRGWMISLPTTKDKLFL